MKHRTLPALTALLMCVAHGPPLLAQSVVDRAKQDELTFVPKGDPAMERAFRKARATLDDFLQLAKDPPEHLRGFALKVGIAEGDDVEYFWINGFSRTGEKFSGLINNNPRIVRRVRLGQNYEFKRSDIVDWLYVDSEKRKMHGNFTACALLTREPPDTRIRSASLLRSLLPSHGERDGLPAD